MLENLLTNDGSRKVIRDLGLDEVITVTSSDDKHQVIQRVYLKYDSEESERLHWFVTVIFKNISLEA